MAYKKFTIPQTISPVFFFHGEDDYLKKIAIEELQETVLTPQDFDFNFNKFDAEEVNFSKVLETVSAFPVFAEKRMVIVSNIERFDQKSKKQIQDYSKKPFDTTCLVLAASGKIDKTKAFYKNLLKNSTNFDFRKLYDNEIPDWVVNYVRSRGKKINVSNAGILATYVGSSIRDLVNEVEKLLIFDKSKDEISKEDIEKVTANSKNFDVFALRNAVGRKDLKKSFEILNNIFEQDNKAGILIVIQLYSLFTNLWKLHSREIASKPTYEIARQRILDTPVEFFVKELIQMSRLYSTDEIENVFAILLKLDLEFKSIQTSQKLLLETAFVKIITGVS